MTEIETTVKELNDQGYSIYVRLPVIDNKFTNPFVKITAIQLSRSVTRCNRRDAVIVEKGYGRNGAKSATVINIPIDHQITPSTP
jgi:hypothetical protein